MTVTVYLNFIKEIVEDLSYNPISCARHNFCAHSVPSVISPKILII